jgi:hypothetical protein
VTDPDPEPFDLFASAAASTGERRQALLDTLAGVTHADQPDLAEARALLEQQLTPGQLAVVADYLDAIAGHAGRETEPEPDVDVLGAALAAKQERKRALADALQGRRPQPPPEETARGSFDGGARPIVRTPPSHGEWLAEVIRTRKADAGGRF